LEDFNVIERLFRSMLWLLAVLLLAGIAGCTEYERKGISPLPQNRPSDWENRPWGDQGFQN